MELAGVGLVNARAGSAVIPSKLDEWTIPRVVESKDEVNFAENDEKKVARAEESTSECGTSNLPSERLSGGLLSVIVVVAVFEDSLPLPEASVIATAEVEECATEKDLSEVALECDSVSVTVLVSTSVGWLVFTSTVSTSVDSAADGGCEEAVPTVAAELVVLRGTATAASVDGVASTAAASGVPVASKVRRHLLRGEGSWRRSRWISCCRRWSGGRR